MDEHQLFELFLRLDQLRHDALDRAGAHILHALREHAVQIDDAAIRAGERAAARRDDLIAHRGELRVAVGHGVVLDVARLLGIDGGQPVFVDILKQVADGVDHDLAVVIPIADRGEGTSALARGNGICQLDHRDLAVGAHHIRAAEIEHAVRKHGGKRTAEDHGDAGLTQPVAEQLDRLEIHRAHDRQSDIDRVLLCDLLHAELDLARRADLGVLAVEALEEDDLDPIPALFQRGLEIAHAERLDVVECNQNDCFLLFHVRTFPILYFLYYIARARASQAAPVKKGIYILRQYGGTPTRLTPRGESTRRISAHDFAKACPYSFQALA